MIRPVEVDPVKLTTGTSLCFVSDAPAPGPSPPTKLTTPGGRPASERISIRWYVESGVSSAGLITSVLPQISAGIIFHAGMAMGKFHGVINPQTPMDWRKLMANLLGSSEGVV